MIDWDELARQTSGDAALQRELLTLFLAQLDDLSRRLGPETVDARERGLLPDLLHRTRGAAAAVGASALAGRLAEAEAALRDCGGGASALLELRTALDAARTTLADLVAAPETPTLAKAGESR